MIPPQYKRLFKGKYTGGVFQMLKFHIFIKNTYGDLVNSKTYNKFAL